MDSQSLDIVIIGGSTAGLMHAIALKRLGHNIHILEQYATHHRESNAAGISTGPHMHEFMSKHDHVPSPYSVPTFGLHMMDPEFRLKGVREQGFEMSCWRVLYYRLRGNFDGLVSEIVPNPPEMLGGEGKAVYDVGKRVVDISPCLPPPSSSSSKNSNERDNGNGKGKQKIEIIYEDVETGERGRLGAHFVIGADGANSTVRELVSGEVEQRYAGYLTWRGTVMEEDVDEGLRGVFGEHALLHWSGKGGNYVIEYMIPGENGSLQPGKRSLNLVWYQNCPSTSSEFTAAMTDTHNKTHRTTVPFGLVPPSIWTHQRLLAQTLFSPPIAALISKIQQPFVTAVRDSIAPKAIHDFVSSRSGSERGSISPDLYGKVVLVGDALALVRSHIAISTSQAAKHALGLEKVFKNEVSLEEWEREVLCEGRVNVWRSRSVGSYFLSRGLVMYFWYGLRARVTTRLYAWGF